MVVLSGTNCHRDDDQRTSLQLASGVLMELKLTQCIYNIKLKTEKKLQKLVSTSRLAFVQIISSKLARNRHVEDCSVTEAFRLSLAL